MLVFFYCALFVLFVRGMGGGEGGLFVPCLVHACLNVNFINNIEVVDSVPGAYL